MLKKILIGLALVAAGLALAACGTAGSTLNGLNEPFLPRGCESVGRIGYVASLYRCSFSSETCYIADYNGNPAIDCVAK